MHKSALLLITALTQPAYAADGFFSLNLSPTYLIHGEYKSYDTIYSEQWLAHFNAASGFVFKSNGVEIKLGMQWDHISMPKDQDTGIDFVGPFLSFESRF